MAFLLVLGQSISLTPGIFIALKCALTIAFIILPHNYHRQYYYFLIDSFVFHRNVRFMKAERKYLFFVLCHLQHYVHSSVSINGEQMVSSLVLIYANYWTYLPFPPSHWVLVFLSLRRLYEVLTFTVYFLKFYWFIKSIRETCHLLHEVFLRHPSLYRSLPVY